MDMPRVSRSNLPEPEGDLRLAARAGGWQVHSCGLSGWAAEASTADWVCQLCTGQPSGALAAAAQKLLAAERLDPWDALRSWRYMCWLDMLVGRPAGTSACV